MVTLRNLIILISHLIEASCCNRVFDMIFNLISFEILLLLKIIPNKFWKAMVGRQKLINICQQIILYLLLTLLLFTI